MRNPADMKTGGIRVLPRDGGAILARCGEEFLELNHGKWPVFLVAIIADVGVCVLYLAATVILTWRATAERYGGVAAGVASHFGTGHNARCYRGKD